MISDISVRGGSTSEHAVMETARNKEDVVVGDEIIRHKLSSRVIHWFVALTFMLALFTGLPIWSPVFGWMAPLFGGLNVCRWLHAWLGIAFAVASVFMFFAWLGQMRFDESDKKFNAISYLKFGSAQEDQNVGKYNAGQKFFFFAAALGALALLLSGIVLWFPVSFSQGTRELSIVLHDLAFIAFFIAIVGHIYLGTAAEPGTFRSMTRGTVTKTWARFHHPRWFREVTGETSERK
jgi:formate dehydrogenase subunit gamma